MASAAEITRMIQTSEPFFGEILDADGHMYIEPEELARITGALGHNRLLDFLEKYMGSPEFPVDVARNRAEIFDVKGISALGASRPEDRPEALDLMGLRKQLVFFNTGSGELRIDSDEARDCCSRYNDYALDWTDRTGERAINAMQINMGDVDWACREAERVIAKGAKLVTLPCSQAPAGVSPAHENWDRFWRILEEADVPATLHLGAGGLIDMMTGDNDEMMPPRAWGNAAALRGRPTDRPGGEEAISPYFMLVAHMSAELYLQTMVMGSVFERFPRLRFGIIELGAAWVGPCVERMDLWANFMARVGRTYTMKPSEFVRRNVRVTPFWHEDLTVMIERFGLEEVYMFSTDYPHIEGSRDPIGRFRKWLAKLPKDYERAFFVDNAKLLFPGE